ncbi:MAG: (Fe-S)-binding protein [Thermoplasmata archaeon]|nr:MAG: (Fe-S)-binding protein [Thermoplasmata archaeon]
MSAIDDLIDDTGAYDCVECGKCTTVCPVAKLDSNFAPRLIVVKALEGVDGGLAQNKDIWRCTTCAICSNMCPYKVDYTEFIRGLRGEAIIDGFEPICSQGGFMHTIARILSNQLHQDRLNWVTDDLKVAKKGEVYYFSGCQAHLNKIFKEKNVKVIDIARNCIRILNKVGITPAMSNNEVCCGHDLNWIGDEATLKKLMEINIKAIKTAGAKKVLFSCPECMRTFDFDYQGFAGDLDFELVYITDFLMDLVDDGKLEFKDKGKEKVTYHDPCRLGRHLGIYDSPRELIEAAGFELIEMENICENATCCGVNAFVTCEALSKTMQINRLIEAKNTQADKLVTACPKCLIHFSCAVWKEIPVEKEKVDIPIIDLISVVTERI